MYSAEGIVGGYTMPIIEKSCSIHKSFFWYPDKNDPKNIVSISKHNAFRYVREFLPAFGFYKFREDDDEENAPYLIVQKMGRRVKIIGSVKDDEISDEIFMWTDSTLKCLAGIAGDINLTHLMERLHSQTAVFTKWTLKFLPDLPTVEAEVEGVLKSVPQRLLRDRDDQEHVCFENGVVVLRKDRAPTLVPYSTLPPFFFVWDKQVRPAVFNEESLEEGPHGHWWDFLQNLAQENNQGKWVVNHEML